MLKHLRRFADWVGQFPSAAFGLGYLIAIPLFSLVYTWMPLDFHDSTARYEPLILAQTDSLAEKLKDVFIADALSTSKSRPTINNYPVPYIHKPGVVQGLPTFSIQPEADYVRINVLFLTVGVPGCKEPFLNVALDFDGSAGVHMVPDKCTPPIKTATVLVSVDVKANVRSGDDVVLPLLFPCSDNNHNNKTCLKMDFEDYSALLSLRSTARGIPTPLQSSYLRMLYFSAVTISTLGYGDIVPVTSRARGVVTLEVILGPVFFGLFLNSLVKEGRAD
jgi:hypothetical protein